MLKYSMLSTKFKPCRPIILKDFLGTWPQKRNHAAYKKTQYSYLHSGENNNGSDLYSLHLQSSFN